MVNEQIIFDTVSRLLEAGIDEPAIVSTLVDNGLSSEEALSLIQRIKSQKASPPGSASVSSTPAIENDVALLKDQLVTQAQEHDLHQTNTISALDAHEEKISEISNQVNEVKESVAKAPVVDPSINYRLGEIEKKLIEVNAQSTACLEVLGKILETNRKILTDLEAQKT